MQEDKYSTWLKLVKQLWCSTQQTMWRCYTSEMHLAHFSIILYHHLRMPLLAFLARAPKRIPDPPHCKNEPLLKNRLKHLQNLLVALGIRKAASANVHLKPWCLLSQFRQLTRFLKMLSLSISKHKTLISSYLGQAGKTEDLNSYNSASYVCVYNVKLEKWRNCSDT